MKTRVNWFSLLVAATWLAAATAAWSADTSPVDPDAKCLKCHSKKLKKPLEDGETMILQINGEAFGDSVHRVIGCTGCHRDIAKRKHPSKQPIASRRAYSLERNEACSHCHEANHTEYEDSVHARMVTAGDDKAPVCSDCHSSHSIQPRAVYEPVSGEPCSTCHTEIYQAYESSVHGQAREHGNVIRDAHVQAPICSDCHQSHQTTAVAAVDYLRDTCLNCHDGAMNAHEKWLPNARMHLTSVACAACHSPMAERRVDLQLYDKVNRVPVAQDTDPALDARINEIDAQGDRLGPVELWKLVRKSSRDGQVTDVTLRGRMEVATGADAHRIAPRSEAVRSCDSCHREGANGFDRVTVSVSLPDGRKQRMDANERVLSSVVSVDSVKDFYAPGGTRIRLLDGLILLAVVGGLAVPIGHMALGRILRSRRKQGKN